MTQRIFELTNLTEAEYGEVATDENGVGGGRTSTGPSPPPKKASCILCLSLLFMLIAFEIIANSDYDFEDVVGVMHVKKEKYEPLIGHEGGHFFDNETDKSSIIPSNSDDLVEGEGQDDMVKGVDDEVTEVKEGEVQIDMSSWCDECMFNAIITCQKRVELEVTHEKKSVEQARKDNIEKCIKPKEAPLSEDRRMPRVACGYLGDQKDRYDCKIQLQEEAEYDNPGSLPSIPKKLSSSGRSSSSEDFNNMHREETDECKLSDPSYQSLKAAPSTCNDVHALPFRFGPSESYPMTGINKIYPSGHKIKYLTSGAFRAVWWMGQIDGSEPENENKFIMKTNRKGGWSSYYLDQCRRDILISERSGSSPFFQPLHSNVLPVYQYCAFSSVVPFSTAGPLDDLMRARQKNGEFWTAEQIYLLALQAARGLAQAQIFKDGKATHTHADVKPPQFLLFFDHGDHNPHDVPVMQINDFNRGKFMTRDVTRHNATCPFRMCHVQHRGSTYRSPEEYMDCADQDDRIDVYSLAGVFYYLMSDGEKPWYHMCSYDSSVNAILNGETPPLPGIKAYERYGDEVMKFVEERMNHPAFLALKEVMVKCWAFKPEDRPSALEVVRMLEERQEEVVPSSKPRWWKKWINKLRRRR